MSFPKAYIAYLVEFHATRDLFECHELLEEYWKEHPDDKRSDIWVGLIQLAVGCYHERRGNLRGALKMLSQAEEKLTASPIEQLGLEKISLQEQLLLRIAYLQTEDGATYTDFNMMINNEEVMNLCKEACEQRGLTWGAPSPLGDDSLIHRHTQRDRTEVIEARLAAFSAKKRERNGSSS